MTNSKHVLKLKQKYITLDKRSRLYGLSLPIIGLTGGIASGKSTVSKKLEELGFFIIDADVLVKEIYQKQDTIAYIQQLIPSCVKKNNIDFKKLREVFFSDTQIKEKIESFIYKKLPAQFLSKTDKSHQNFIIYDVPLLFEKALNSKVDFIITVYANKETQIQRLKERDDISQSLAETILLNQQDIEEKKEKSHYVVDNCHDLSQTYVQIQDLTNQIFE